MSVSFNVVLVCDATEHTERQIYCQVTEGGDIGTKRGTLDGEAVTWAAFDIDPDEPWYCERHR